jgi:hypothetical protein
MFAFQRDTKIAPEAPILDASVKRSDTPTPTEYEFSSSTMPKLSNKFKNAIQTTAFDGGETNLSALEDMLESEKQSNKLAAWNKLDKTSRVQKLHAFAEKYGREHGLPVKEIKNLKVFFTGALDKGRLNRAKDVVYDRELREVKSVPALHFNNDSRAFTLRNLEDAKRVSTLKCLTPSRRTPKVTSDEDLPKVTSDEDLPKVTSEQEEEE